MKNLTALLSQGNLTPKERILLWVANKISEDREGKQILTEADKQALVHNWRPKDNSEAREYNRYNDGWRAVILARTDAHTTYLNAKISLLQVRGVIDMLLFADEKKFTEKSATLLEGLGIDEDDALELVLGNSGLEFNRAVYRHAFESVSEGLKRDILALDPDAETESQYLDQEEMIADLFGGKEKLTKEAKEKLAETMAYSPYSEFAKWWQMTDEIRAWMDDWWIGGFYASVPNVEIAKRWANYNGVYAQKEIALLEEKESVELEEELTAKMKEYAQQQGVDMRALLKSTVLRWLDDGLFVNEYAPLCNSKDKEICNDASTKLPHKEVFRQWIAAKATSKALLQNLIDQGDLALKDMDREIFGVKKTLKVITGESLYRLGGDFAFAQDFKKQADDFIGIGRFCIFMREHGFLKEYASLLGFVEIFRRLSKTYDIDMGYKLDKYMCALKEQVELLNRVLRIVAEKAELASYIKHEVVLLKETFIEDMLIDLEKIEPGEDETVKHYRDEFKRLLGGDF